MGTAVYRWLATDAVDIKWYIFGTGKLAILPLAVHRVLGKSLWRFFVINFMSFNLVERFGFCWILFVSKTLQSSLVQSSVTYHQVKSRISLRFPVELYLLVTISKYIILLYQFFMDNLNICCLYLYHYILWSYGLIRWLYLLIVIHIIFYDFAPLSSKSVWIQ